MAGEQLRRLRKLADATRGQMAHAIGQRVGRRISIDEIDEWEDGGKEIPVNVQNAINEIDAEFRAAMGL